MKITKVTERLDELDVSLKMLLGAVIFSALVIGSASSLRNCHDCVNINECPQAVKELDKKNVESIAKLRRAICGFDEILKKSKVCCSDFAIHTLQLVNKTESTDNEENNDDEIMNHPNLRLLSAECGNVKEGNRTIDGKIPLPYEFPWLALISHRSRKIFRFSCAGTLINERYVLTAAHCIKDRDIAGVRVGDDDISKKLDCYGEGEDQQCIPKYLDIAVTEATIHPDFVRKPRIINNIGLLRLQTPVDFSFGNTGTICLPVFKNLREMNITRQMGTIAGWGAMNSESLLKVETPIHSMETCKNHFDRNRKQGDVDFLRNTLCAGETILETCKGDAGGPLMLKASYNESYKIVQYGLMSYGKVCGTDGPEIFTDVRKYVKWILDNIKP